MKTDIHISIEETGFAVKARCVVKSEDSAPVGMNSVHQAVPEALGWACDFARAEMEDAA